MQEQKRLNILFTAAWYPHMQDPLYGLFVQKHAEAVKEFCDVSVLYVHPVKDQKEKFEIKVSNHKDIIEVRVYYRKVKSNIPLISDVRRGYRYIAGTWAGFKSLKDALGYPDLVHVNVLSRAGLIAWYLKKRKNIPYIITEHWSRYLPQTGTYKGLLRKMVTKAIVKNAAYLTVVTENLKNAMAFNKLSNPKTRIIHNVVDTTLFKPGNIETGRKKRVLHVSCFEEKSKNITGILHLIHELSKKRIDFELHMVGEGLDFQKSIELSEKLGLKDKVVFFKGAKFDEELAKEYKDADFLLMFSNYENMPVVINEAFSCGLPVISSDVGGISEHVNSERGVLVEKVNNNEMIEKLNYMLDHFHEYNSAEIRKYAIENYSFEKVGETFLGIYKRILELN